MLVHKGGQINNVQLITGVRIAEMSQLQNCSVVCTKKREKVRGRGVGQGSQVGGGVGGGQGGCERRSEAFVKIHFFFGGGEGCRVGGQVGGSGWM